MKLIKASDRAFLLLKETVVAARSETPKRPLTDDGVRLWLRAEKPVKSDPRAAWRSLFKEEGINSNQGGENGNG